MPLKVRKNNVAPPPASCPLAECMAMIGGAWTANVIWYLSARPRRFGELRIDIPAVSAKSLSARLKRLEATGIIARRAVPTSPPSAEYALTELGRELLPAIEAILRVGEKLKRQQTRKHAAE